MISPKQKKILSFPYSKYRALICDGAVRSGKTSIMTVSFVDWAMREFSGRRFGICGKTVDSTVKNIIAPYITMQYAKERYTIRWRRSDKIMEVSHGNITNYFEVFGGKDESSFMLIQGRTLAGVLLDEVALMPESFVNQALARCSVSGAKLWFSCNPEGPAHWFYQEWILKSAERNALYLHFRMYDNPSLSQDTLEMYESMYSGVFYERYILGKWVIAEGLVYPMFSQEKHVVDKPIEIRSGSKYYVSIDYGTVNPFVALVVEMRGQKSTVLKEIYYDGRKNERVDDEAYYKMLKDEIKDIPIQKIVVDPSAASFIATVVKYREYLVEGAKNDVLNGIQEVTKYLNLGLINVNKSCVNTITEFQQYAWDDKAGEDKVIKESDHCMDALRYYIYGVARAHNIWRV